MKATVMQRVILVSSAILFFLTTIRIPGLWTARGDCWDPHQVVEGGLVHKGSQGHSHCEGLFCRTSGNSMTTTVVLLLKQVFKQPTGSFPVRWDYQLVIFPMSRSSP